MILVRILDIVIGGLLTGGIFALIAVGFGLQYGVARVLNIAHGEFIMLGAFCAWTLFTKAGITPLVSMIICAPFFFAIGYVIYRILYNPLRSSSASAAATGRWSRSSGSSPTTPSFRSPPRAALSACW